MNRLTTRREVLLWLAKGTFVCLACFALPLRWAARAKGHGKRRSMTIPVKPFDPADLRRPHDLAG